MRDLVHQRVDEELGDIVGGSEVGFVDSRLSVDAEADGHLAFGHLEQRLIGPGQRAPGERDSAGPGPVVGQLADSRDLIEGHAGFRGGGRHLQHGQSAGDAATLVCFFHRCGRDIVGDGSTSDIEAIGFQELSGHAELQHVAGVVQVGQENAAAVIGSLGDAMDLGGRR